MRSTQALPLTGERTIPGLAEENYWFRRHEVVYQRLAGRCVDREVLEAGCGEGYGADLTGRRGAHASIALDYDEATVAHVRARYPRVEIRHGNLAELPLADSSVDVVVNFQVIEHLWDQGQFVSECFRVLRPGGVFLVSTPNRITFSPGRDTPLNPFHTRELNAAELTELLHDAGFTVESMLGVFHGAGLARAGRPPRRFDHRGAGAACGGRRTVARATARRCGRRGHRRLRPHVAPTNATLTTASTWSRSRCGRDAIRSEPEPEPVPRLDVAGDPAPGLFTLVLHTHLPWLAHHGRWPVGEEWLYQSWAAAYLPLMRVLRGLAAEDRSHLITLGMTPVVTAQLDDPYCLTGMHHWLANWQLRAQEATTLREEEGLAAVRDS